MTKTDDHSEKPAENTVTPKRGLDLSPTQVIAGGAAAAVASVIGGQLGLGGTVVGAFILSVISAVAVPLFRASLEKSHQQIKRVVPRRSTDIAPFTPSKATDTSGTSRAGSSKVSASPLPGEASLKEGGTPFTPRKFRMAVGGTAAIFAIGVGSVVGVQAATGTSLSKGTADLQTGISQVASNGSNTPISPPTTKRPGGRDADTGATPTATAPAGDSVEADTPTPNATTKQTVPTGKATPQPSVIPSQAPPTAGPSSTAKATGGQAGPGLPAATAGPAAK
ncbi:hypothetical protein AB0280_00790 [Pseudarthrobacter sp902506025]|uniref:Uncharacterized protein n=1 Tax=Pseudarthrobacter defluvii TaxID=410837 RepID=A0ABT9UFK1_9MICC|nr:hypothetical protein [Pseudarthrobacter defluvii]MDQ0118413.1 hypothetical protein [Pseudarthrobacter defluvii]